MTESPPPPLPNTKLWWYAWILATVILPGAMLWLLAILPGMDTLWLLAVLLVLGLHLVASSKLGKGRSGWLTAGLIFGGWALMLVSMFIGCIALMNQSQNH